MKIYKCDYCGNLTSLIKREADKEFPFRWFSLNGKVELHNELEDGRVTYAGIDAGLHFCSRKCLEKYLFKTKNVI